MHAGRERRSRLVTKHLLCTLAPSMALQAHRFIYSTCPLERWYGITDWTDSHLGILRQEEVKAHPKCLSWPARAGAGLRTSLSDPCSVPPPFLACSSCPWLKCHQLPVLSRDGIPLACPSSLQSCGTRFSEGEFCGRL